MGIHKFTRNKGWKRLFWVLSVFWWLLCIGFILNERPEPLEFAVAPGVEMKRHETAQELLERLEAEYKESYGLTKLTKRQEGLLEEKAVLLEKEFALQEETERKKRQGFWIAASLMLLMPFLVMLLFMLTRYVIEGFSSEEALGGQL